MNEAEYNSSAVSASDCIGSGWNLVTQNLGIYIGVTLVFGIILFVVGLIPFASVIITGPLTGGLYYLALRHIDGEPIDFGMMFKGFEKFVPLMIVSIIQGIPAIIWTIIQFTVNVAQLFGLPSIMGRPSRVGDTQFFQPTEPQLGGLAALSGIVIIIAIGFIIFSIVWNLIFYFAVPLIVDRNLPAFEAIRLSFASAFGNIGGLILLIILEILVIILGMIALCLGLLVAIPVVWVANAIAYRMVFPRLTDARWTTPPPPSAYSDQFGGAA